VKQGSNLVNILLNSTIRLYRKLSFGYGFPGIKIIKQYNVFFKDIFVI
jgi:hypothetical protein